MGRVHKAERSKKSKGTESSKYSQVKGSYKRGEATLLCVWIYEAKFVSTHEG